VGVIKADQPLAVRPVQRQRIIESVRLLRRHRYARHHESDPVTPSRIDHEYLSVEIQKRVQARVGRVLSHREVITLT
jgi:hypothetical protein